jgi:hypothetical protein
LTLTEARFCQLQQTVLSRLAWNKRYAVSSLKVKKIQQCLSIAFYTSRNFGAKSKWKSWSNRRKHVRILIWLDLRHSRNDKFRGFLWDKIRVLWNTWQYKVARKCNILQRFLNICRKKALHGSQERD